MSPGEQYTMMSRQPSRQRLPERLLDEPARHHAPPELALSERLAHPSKRVCQPSAEAAATASRGTVRNSVDPAAAGKLPGLLVASTQRRRADVSTGWRRGDTRPGPANAAAAGSCPAPIGPAGDPSNGP